MPAQEEEEDNEPIGAFDGFRTQSYSDYLNRWFTNARIATLAWVGCVVLYWTILVMIPCIIENELNTYQYYLWIFGMIGTASVYYAVKADHPADSPAGKPLVALTCLFISFDLIAHAWSALHNDDLRPWEGVLMVFHSLAILWASLFFYNRALKNGQKLAWLTLFVQWLDIVFMGIVIMILHHEFDGDCLSRGICIGYFVVLCINVCLWFFPIMFGYSDTEKFIHIHMVILDSFTDLPLVLVIIFDKGYKVHWFVFIDVTFKILLLLRTYSYHLLLNLILRRRELDVLQKQQKEQIELENELFEKGVGDDEMELQLRELAKRQTVDVENQN